MDPCTIPVVTFPSEEDLPSTAEYLVEDEKYVVNILEYAVLPTQCVTTFHSDYSTEIIRTVPETAFTQV